MAVWIQAQQLQGDALHQMQSLYGQHFPIENALTTPTANALQTLLIGLHLNPTLTLTVSPACAGLRTAIAAALLGALIPRSLPRETARCSWKKRLIGATLGLLTGFWLNLIRILIIELTHRTNPALAATLHNTATYTLLLPTALLLLTLLRHLPRPAKITLTAAASLLLPLITRQPFS